MAMRRHQRPDRRSSRALRDMIIGRAVDEELKAGAARDARVVVGVDGSPGSMRALAWAAAEARIRSAVLEVVHVDVFRHEVMDQFGPSVLGSEHAVLDEAVARASSLEPSVVVEAKLCEPPAGQALISASEDAGLLVVGSSNGGGPRNLALGSVSTECALHARCPIVIIPSITRTEAVAIRDFAAGDPC